MKTFDFVALTLEGATRQGREVAASLQELDERIEARGLTLLRATAISQAGGRMKAAEVIHFASQLAVTIQAGVPLLEALEAIARRSPRAGVRRVIERVLAGLREGASLSEAMDVEAASFPASFRAAVRAGEASGALGTVLERVARNLEWQASVRSTARQALIYPAILGLALVGLVVLMLTFLVPKLAAIYPGGSEDLPMPTQVVVGLSELLRAWWPAFVLPIGALVLGLPVLLRRPRIAEALDRFLLSLPGLGGVQRQISTARFASTAATLQSAGCDIAQVLSIAGETCGNRAMGAVFARTAKSAQQGHTLTEGLEGEPLADPLLVQLVAVGESAGDLDGCLARLAAWYDEEVPRRVKRFLAFLEPTLLLLSALTVGFLLLAALLPVFRLYDAL